MSRPSPNGGNGGSAGRDGRGRFSRGNKGGPGNPMAARVGRLRMALLEAVTEEDIATAVRSLIKRARAGEVAAVRELLDRCIGRPVEADLIERLEALETALRAEERQ